MQVKSYIKIPNLLLTDDFLEHPEDFFVDVDDTERLRSISKNLDKNYIDGAIVISHCGNKILDFTLWDLVGVTWGYIINTIEEFLEKGNSVMYLPDQPIKIEMEEITKELIRFVIGKGEYGDYVLPRKELLNALVDGAKHFFLIVKRELGINNFDYHLEQIETIKAKI